jgi:VWFA-related protein
MTRSLVPALLLLIAAVAPAQQPAVVSTDLATRSVELVVTDRDGNRVSGVPQSDFQLYEDGLPRDITRFAERHGGDAAPRSIVFVFDLASLTPAARQQAIANARQFLSANLRPADRVAIFSSGGVLTRASDWTNDATVLATSLDVVAASTAPSATEQRDVTRSQLHERLQSAEAATAHTPVDYKTLASNVRTVAQSQAHDAAATIAELSAVLTAFGASPARNVLVVAGHGLPLHPAAEEYASLERVRSRIEQGLTGAKSKEVRDAAPLAEASRLDLERAVRSLASRAVSRGVAIYPFDAASNARDDAYAFLAAQTGGAATLADVAHDLDGTYSLQYHSAAKAGDVPSVDVKSKSGYRVRTVFGGVPLSRENAIAELVVANQVASLGGNELGIKVAADPIIEGEDKRHHVKLKIFIPVRNLTLARDGEFLTGGFDVYVATGDAIGNSSVVNRQTHAIRWPSASAAEVVTKTITYAIDIVLETSRRQISVAVVDQASQKTGYGKIGV